MNLRIGIVGCGLIGRRRATVAREAGHHVVIVSDLDSAKAAQLAQECRAEATADWRQVIQRPDMDAIVVSTVNKALAPVTIGSLESGKHVLCEKPLGRNAAEAEQMVRAARKAGRILKTGFNHRHHPAIWKARALAEQGLIGPLLFIRAVYGHGGRPGYDSEWRANPDLAGGGELLDQGVHILDLCRWFMGDYAEVFAMTGTFFWKLPDAPTHRRTDAPKLEDNAFALLRTRDGRVAQFHTSWTQWRNRFSFEVFGREGCLGIEGLGGSYGTETLTVTRRRKAGGLPDEDVQEFPGPDQSWQLEWQEFVGAIEEGRQPLANGEDGLQVMRLIQALYESARTGQVVKFPISVH